MQHQPGIPKEALLSFLDRYLNAERNQRFLSHSMLSQKELHFILDVVWFLHDVRLLVLIRGAASQEVVKWSLATVNQGLLRWILRFSILLNSKNIQINVASDVTKLEREYKMLHHLSLERLWLFSIMILFLPIEDLKDSWLVLITLIHAYL